MLVALAVLCLFFSLRYPSNFPTSNNIQNMTQVGGILLVVALGQMCAILIGGFDLSVAANMGFVGVVAGLDELDAEALFAAVAARPATRRKQ